MFEDPISCFQKQIDKMYDIEEGWENGTKQQKFPPEFSDVALRL